MILIGRSYLVALTWSSFQERGFRGSSHAFLCFRSRSAAKSGGQQGKSAAQWKKQVQIKRLKRSNTNSFCIFHTFSRHSNL